MSINTPKVSVVMAAYNAEKYINEAIDSILNQTFKDFEFIIVNDSSTDGTQKILDSYHDTRIIIIINEKNMGRSEARNKGILVSRGEYIAIMDADDISLPERLKREVEFLDYHNDIAAVGSYFFDINEKGRIVGIEKFVTESDDIKEILPKGNIIANSTAMLRKSCLGMVGSYRKEFKVAEDYDLFLRLSESFNLANLKEPLFKRRIHLASCSVANKNEMDIYTKLAQKLAKERREFIKDRLQIFKESGNEKALIDFLPKPQPQSRKEMAQSYFYWGRVLFRGKDYTGALDLLSKAFIRDPWCPWILVLEDFVLVNFPKPVVNVLGCIRRSLFIGNAIVYKQLFDKNQRKHLKE